MTEASPISEPIRGNTRNMRLTFGLVVGPASPNSVVASDMLEVFKKKGRQPGTKMVDGFT